MIRRPRRPPLFPYTPLSRPRDGPGHAVGRRSGGVMQHRRVRGARVFDVEIDVPRRDRLMAHERAAQMQLAIDEEAGARSEEHTSELQSLAYLVCRLLLEKKK